MSLDRVQGGEVVATHEQITHMLGVRREGVTEGALRLQGLGLIRYARGRILVLDRHGLEKQACECHAVVKKEYDRLLPETATIPGPWQAPVAHPDPGRTTAPSNAPTPAATAIASAPPAKRMAEADVA